jgi:hypothetical protein
MEGGMGEKRDKKKNRRKQGQDVQECAQLRHTRGKNKRKKKLRA